MNIIRKLESEEMRAVWNKYYGFYVDTRFSRKEMIEKHTSDMNMTWDECRKYGDRVVRVSVTPVQTRKPSKVKK